MLLGLLSFLCSAVAVLANDTVNQDTLNELLLQASLPGHLTLTKQSEAARMMMEPEQSEYCPASKVLKQIELMLSRLYYQNDGNTIFDKTITRQGFDSLLERSLNRENRGQSLVIPVSRVRSLKELLESSKLQQKLRTKVTVQYELPSVEESSCKQTLSQILQLLQEVNPNSNFFRSCKPTEKCPKENIIDIVNKGNNNVLSNKINQGNGYQPYEQPSSSSNFKETGENNKEFINLLKQILASKNIKEDINVNKEITNSHWNELSTSELVKKLNLSSFLTNPKLYQVSTKNLSDGNYQINIPEQILNQHLQVPNQSEKLAETFKISAQTTQKQEKNVEDKSNDYIDVVANQSNVFPFVQYFNNKGIENDASKGEKVTFTINSSVPTKNVLSGNTEQQPSLINFEYKPDILKGPIPNVTDNKITISDAVNTGIDNNNYANTMFQYQLHNQNPELQLTNIKYPKSESIFLNQNMFSNQHNKLNPYISGSLYQPPYQIGSGSNNFYVNDGKQYNQYAGIRIPNMLNNGHVFYTSYIKSNPYLVSSKLINNLKQAGSQFYEPFNITNLQRIVGVANRAKLNSYDNNGIVELTYLLRQPNPVVYQPVYYVKYQLPYGTFLNLRELLSNRPELRADPAKLKQELLTVSQVAEVSPSLRGLEQQKLMELVKASGALVNTKVLSLNDTLLEEQLNTVRNLNSMLAPNDIVNVTYSIIVKTDKYDGPDKFKFESSGTNQNGAEIKYVKDSLRSDSSFASDTDAASTEVPNITTVQDNITPSNSPV